MIQSFSLEKQEEKGKEMRWNMEPELYLDLYKTWMAFCFVPTFFNPAFPPTAHWVIPGNLLHTVLIPATPFILFPPFNKTVF